MSDWVSTLKSRVFQFPSSQLSTLVWAPSVMDELRSALSSHADLIEKLSDELRAGLRPAIDKFVDFFHAIDWKFFLLLTGILSRKNDKVQFFISIIAFSGIYFAEKLNGFLGDNWKSFASQNYFDSHGLFISVIWSGPLLLVSMLVVVNTLFALCRLIIKWKRAELRDRARLAQSKQD